MDKETLKNIFLDEMNKDIPEEKYNEIVKSVKTNMDKINSSNDYDSLSSMDKQIVKAITFYHKQQNCRLYHLLERLLTESDY